MKIHPHVQSVIDPDGAVLLDLNRGKYFSLNVVAVEIWKRLEAGAGLPEIEAHLRDTYDVPAGRLRQDLQAFIEHLMSQNLIEHHDEP